MTGNDTATQLIQQSVRISYQYLDFWKNHVLFTADWWALLIWTVLPLILWVFLRKKGSTSRLLYAGIIVFLATSFLDFTGYAFGFWRYTANLVPTLPPFIPWESTLTVEYMLVLQYKPEFSPWLKGLLLALVNAYVFEEMAIWVGWYVPVRWQHIYSVPIYMAIYLIAHYAAHAQSFQSLNGERD